MTASPAIAQRVNPLRIVRRVLDTVERALRPAADRDPVEPGAVDTAAPDLDTSTTRELLLPVLTGEAPARRAQRQASDYLERRRRKLAEQLGDSR